MTARLPDAVGTRPSWSLAGFNLGARLALPVMPGMIAFGLAVGATASRKGFSLLDSLVMNLFVYAGTAQLVAMEAWPERLTTGAIAGLLVIVATINARMLLIGAALHPWLGPLPASQVYPLLHLATDPGWLIAMRYRAEGGSDAGVFLGACVVLAIGWMGATTLGFLLGALITDPRRYGLDLVMPVFFAAMMVPLWRGARRCVAWAVAGAVALAVQQLLGGWWFIAAGSIAGSVVGGFLDDVE
jgi:predicted branched-subunit amino acid permease